MLKTPLNDEALSRVNEASQAFDRWMKKYEESHLRSGSYDDINKTLLQFLYHDVGYIYIKTYEEFCQLSTLVREIGYGTTTPPCELSDFEKALQKGLKKKPSTLLPSRNGFNEEKRELLELNGHSFFADAALQRYYKSPEGMEHDFLMSRERAFS